MARMETKAWAKLNLTLDVLGKRADGYHELRMVMQTVDLCDHITVETGTGAPLRVGTDLGFLPTGEKNITEEAVISEVWGSARLCLVQV